MNKITEKRIKEKVKHILKEHGVFYFMPMGGLYGQAGVTDFVCCIGGHYVAIETKAPARGEKGLTTLQLLHRDKVREAEGMWLLVYDDETLSELDAWLNDMALIDL